MKQNIWTPQFWQQQFLSLDSNMRNVLKNSLSSAFVRVGGMFATMLFSVFLGRTLGADGMGVVNLANRIVNLLLVVVLCGMPTAIIKESSISYSNFNWKEANGVIRSAKWFSTIFSLVLIVIGIACSEWLCLHVFHEPRLTLPLIITLISLLPQVLTRIDASMLNGFRKIWQANLFENALASLIVLFIIMIIYLANIEISIVNVSWAYALSKFFVSMVSAFLCRLQIPSDKREEKGSLEIKLLLRRSLPFFLSSAVSVIAMNIDGIMIGWFSSSRELGLYAAATNLALLMSFFMSVASSALNPHIASLHVSGKLKELEKMLQRVTLILIVLGLLSGLFFVFFGKFILSIWGKEFEDAYQMLLVLCLGQFVNVSTGCVGSVLVMCGCEKIEAKILLISLTSNVILNYLLISNYGALGAAFSTTLTLSIAMLVRVGIVKKKLGISMW